MDINLVDTNIQNMDGEAQDARFNIQALFTSKNFCKIGIVVLSFVFDKYCSNMD